MSKNRCQAWWPGHPARRRTAKRTSARLARRLLKRFSEITPKEAKKYFQTIFW